MSIHTGILKHLCCGEYTTVVPSSYCPFCGKSVREYGVEIDDNIFGSFLTDKLEEAGVKVNRSEPKWFPSRIGEEPPSSVSRSPLQAPVDQGQPQE